MASRRPYDVFLLVNLAVLAIATGPADRGRRSLACAIGASGGSSAARVLAVGIAAASGMSKGEVERIWLPFSVWLLPAGAALAVAGDPSRWLALQLAFAIGVQTLVRSPW